MKTVRKKVRWANSGAVKFHRRSKAIPFHATGKLVRLWRYITSRRVEGDMSIELVAMEAENIRGHTHARLDLSSDRILLVGRNNSGKTSALLLLNWLFNLCKRDVLEGKENPSSTDLDILLPARNTRNKARRLTLHVRITDGRRRRRFKCNKQGIALIRIGIRSTHRVQIIAKLGKPKKGETTQSDGAAINLLDEVRKKFRFEHVPSFRDAASPRFQQTLFDAFRKRLSEKALHDQQAGAPTEYRQIRKVGESLQVVAKNLINPLLEEIQRALPTGIIQNAAYQLNCEPQDIVNWMAENLTLRLSTGRHDEQQVKTVSVGSGLQSLLELAINSGARNADGAKLILAVEEPEAFLHPSAQRMVARRLFTSPVASKMMITTHSPVIVEEARYEHVVITRDHRFYQSRKSVDNRVEINTALLTGYGAEMIFARSVLFVEGEGDRQFFENLRRRIAAKDQSGDSDQLFVVPVGGNRSFAPWLRLAQSYGGSSDRPIRWTVVGDSDAAAEIRRAFKDAKISIPTAVRASLDKVVTALNAEQPQQWIDAVREANSQCVNHSVSLRLLPGDLEFAALQNASNSTLGNFAQKAGHKFECKNEFVRWLGSKAIDGRSRDDAFKAPWFRGYMGLHIPAADIHDDIREVLSTWLNEAMQKKQAETLIASLD